MLSSADADLEAVGAIEGAGAIFFFYRRSDESFLVDVIQQTAVSRTQSGHPR
jgi:hypothetical protein